MPQTARRAVDAVLRSALQHGYRVLLLKYAGGAHPTEVRTLQNIAELRPVVWRSMSNRYTHCCLIPDIPGQLIAARQEPGATGDGDTPNDMFQALMLYAVLEEGLWVC